jgi:hypothetical protein
MGMFSHADVGAAGESYFFQGFDDKFLAGSVISRVACCIVDFGLINTIFGRPMGPFVIEIALN